jgi:membrane protein DedA with SNARE-associated domain
MDILQNLVGFFTDYGYAAVFGVLLVCGFGVPIPEDITLVAGGIISGLGYTNVHIMLVVSMVGVLVGDGTMFMLGRLFGPKILKFRPVAKLMSNGRYEAVQRQFEKHGNRVLFAARFMPGLRSPIFMTAGITRRVSIWRFLAMDGFAALISVPIWVYLGYYGADNREWLMKQVTRGQHGILILLGILALVGGFYYFKYRKNKIKAKMQSVQDSQGANDNG